MTEYCGRSPGPFLGGGRDLLASAGLDREVILWDVGAAKAVSTTGQLRWQKASGHKDSVYCLATNADGSVIVSGSTERVSTHAIGLLRLWDSRTGQKVCSNLMPLRETLARPLEDGRGMARMLVGSLGRLAVGVVSRRHAEPEAWSRLQFASRQRLS